MKICRSKCTPIRIFYYIIVLQFCLDFRKIFYKKVRTILSKDIRMRDIAPEQKEYDFLAKIIWPYLIFLKTLLVTITACICNIRCRKSTFSLTNDKFLTIIFFQGCNPLFLLLIKLYFCLTCFYCCKIYIS